MRVDWYPVKTEINVTSVEKLRKQKKSWATNCDGNCKKIKNGLVEFKGKKDLDKGVYTLVSQGKSIYFDIFINENQKFKFWKRKLFQ
mgnify:CR=1 FL=1